MAYRIRVGKNQFNEPHYICFACKGQYRYSAQAVPRTWQSKQRAQKHLWNILAHFASAELEQCDD